MQETYHIRNPQPQSYYRRGRRQIRIHRGPPQNGTWECLMERHSAIFANRESDKEIKGTATPIHQPE